MRSIDARRLRHWVRRNLFDPWQVLGTAGLVVGILALGFLAVNARELERSTGKTIHEFQTLVSQPIDPSDEPTAVPAPAPAPAASPTTAQAAPAATVSGHLPRRATPVPEPSIIPTPVPSVSPTADATPTPTADATPTPSDTASPTPDPSTAGSVTEQPPPTAAP